MTEIGDFGVQVSWTDNATSHKIYKIVKYNWNIDSGSGLCGLCRF